MAWGQCVIARVWDGGGGRDGREQLMRHHFIGNLLEAACAGKLILSLSKSLPLIVCHLQKKAQIWAWWHILVLSPLGRQRREDGEF